MTEPSNLPPPAPMPRRSRLAIASLGLAASLWLLPFLLFVTTPSEAGGKLVMIVLLLCFVGLPVFSIASLVAIYRSHGQLVGKGMAIGSLCILAIFFIVAFLSLPDSGPHTVPRSNRMKCAQNLKQISLALDNYYEDNNHHYPPSLSSLVPQYVSFLGIFQCPSAKAQPMKGNFDEQLCSYRYICYPDDSARKFDDKMVLAFDKGSDHQMEGMNAVFADGHVCFWSRERFIAMLGELAGNEKLSMPTREALRKTLAEVMAEGPVKRESP